MDVSEDTWADEHVFEVHKEYLKVLKSLFSGTRAEHAIREEVVLTLSNRACVCLCIRVSVCDPLRHRRLTDRDSLNTSLGLVLREKTQNMLTNKRHIFFLTAFSVFLDVSLIWASKEIYFYVNTVTLLYQKKKGSSCCQHIIWALLSSNKETMCLYVSLMIKNVT